MNIVIRDISKSYGENRILDQVCLNIESGEIVSIIGPSGSGKTTLLNLIAGLLPPSSGQILVDGQDIQQCPTESRGIGFVFQEPSLYPNMNVYRNIAFPLEMQRRPKKDIQKDVLEVADMLHITHLLKRKPRQLSGGEQQRVAIARAFVKAPALILFDEPFSNLDVRLALELREELKKLLRQTHTTAVFVTHSQNDAISMSDKIAVLHRGKILQYGAPTDVYHRPQCPFVANFIGKYPINQIRGRVTDGVFHEQDGLFRLPTANGSWDGVDKVIMFRPESVSVTVRKEDADFSATVIDCFTDGKENIVTVSAGKHTIRLYTNADVFPSLGEQIGLCVDTRRVFVFDVPEDPM